MSTNSLAEVLAGLQKSYLASMPEKISNLQALHLANDLVKLETEYHKLKGTGRTYGLPEVTQLGAVLERVCQIAPDLLSKSVPLSLTLLAQIRDTRIQGQPYVLEGVSEFEELGRILAEAEAKAG